VRGRVRNRPSRHRSGTPPRLSLNGRPITQIAQLGAFAERILVHHDTLVRVSADIPLDQAALLGSG
jgi:S-(hydroxymethyl)glutathione dehydrogenase/alcohol dehydrogenase